MLKLQTGPEGTEHHLAGPGCWAGVAVMSTSQKHGALNGITRGDINPRGEGEGWNAVSEMQRGGCRTGRSVEENGDAGRDVEGPRREQQKSL